MTSIHDYSDIISLPRPEPKRHTRMSIQARAAQFAPFAALSGYAAVIEEISRNTDEKPILDESVLQKINRRLLFLQSHPEPDLPIRITRFVPDPKKSGGRIETIVESVKKVDDYKKQLILTDGQIIAFEDILDITINY